jgi:hypothetical protein
MGLQRDRLLSLHPWIRERNNVAGSAGTISVTKKGAALISCDRLSAIVFTAIFNELAMFGKHCLLKCLTSKWHSKAMTRQYSTTP